MTRLLDTLLRLDNLARIGARALGARSACGRELQQAAADLRRDLAPLALHQEAEQPDPKTDLMRVLAAAEDAGLSWPDIRDALNRYHETRTR
ncbi:conserved protein of unknown function [Magnetospirillum sp. XM-1]|uniref:hypothetical protein n=1 Tax=Magnetospirillum sp. XM-1 TaxID=1663591 RepID=UPI00073DFFF4|nr:hypothetical protein [Magnetospirillum sp. XM-1]CUW41114.1 conserved protein of unknown function [Magnetospirillum sp. XM-1]